MIPKIYTSYFAKTKQLVENNILPVAISLTVPSWFAYPRFKELAPNWETVKRIKESDHTQKDIMLYEKDYFNSKLSKYSMNVRNLLELIVYTSKYNNVKYPNGIALLCYETPDKFCHRKIVSAFINHSYPGCVTEFSTTH